MRYAGGGGPIFSITTFSKMTLSIKGLSALMKFRKKDPQHNNSGNNTECLNAECRALLIVTLNVVMLSVVAPAGELS